MKTATKHQIRVFLTAEFRTRCESDVDYNLKRFALDLGLRPSQLSEILSGKHRLTIPKAKKIADNIKLTKQEYSELLGKIKGHPKEVSQNGELSALEQRSFRVASAWFPKLRDKKFLQRIAQFLDQDSIGHC